MGDPLRLQNGDETFPAALAWPLPAGTCALEVADVMGGLLPTFNGLVGTCPLEGMRPQPPHHAAGVRARLQTVEPNQIKESMGKLYRVSKVDLR